MENKRGEIVTFLTIATLVFIGIANITSSIYNSSKQTRTTATKAAEGDGAGGACVAGRGGSDSKGCGGEDGCRAWEKCVNGGCQDTTNLGKQSPAVDSCGSSPGTAVGVTNNSTRGNSCSKPTCVYSQQDADGVHCYEGNRKDNNKGYGFNNNCGWISGCSTGKRVDCPTGNAVNSGGGQSQITSGSSSGVAGCFHMEGSSNYAGNGKFDITIRFVSDGGDGDIQLERDGQHLAGWNRWNKGASGNVWTWTPEWTGSPVSVGKNETKTVTYKGYVANSAACPGVQETLACNLAVDSNGNGSGSCGGGARTLPANPAPTNNNNQSSSISQKPSNPIPTPTSTPANKGSVEIKPITLKGKIVNRGNVPVDRLYIAPQISNNAAYYPIKETISANGDYELSFRVNDSSLKHTCQVTIYKNKVTEGNKTILKDPILSSKEFKCENGQIYPEINLEINYSITNTPTPTTEKKSEIKCEALSCPAPNQIIKYAKKCTDNSNPCKSYGYFSDTSCSQSINPNDIENNCYQQIRKVDYRIKVMLSDQAKSNVDNNKDVQISFIYVKPDSSSNPLKKVSFRPLTYPVESNDFVNIPMEKNIRFTASFCYSNKNENSIRCIQSNEVQYDSAASPNFNFVIELK